MSSTSQCPKCKSLKVVRARSEEWKEPFTFQVFASRKCLDCGEIWEPAASRWLFACGVVAGLFFLGMGVVLFGEGNSFSGTTCVVLGGGTIIGCIKRWRAKSHAP